ncbi:hypothetical protein KJ885_01065, partial [Patescibacteria group bacterium]|nr:hypothetical protein [Patescibacteria group bacterium]
YAADLDFCEGVATAPAPTAPADCHKGKNGNFSYCTSSCPCDKGQGDCDSNKECKSGLKCVNNVGKKYGWNWTVDVCE